MRAGLQITRLTALSQPRSCDLRNARPTRCLCGHSGYKSFKTALEICNTACRYFLTARFIWLFEGVIVPTALYGAEAWGMRSAERRKVNVLEMKCLRSLVGVSRMDRVRNEEVRIG